MKYLIPFLAVAFATVAFGGTEVTHLQIANSTDFFKGDASNFRIDSIELAQDPIVDTAVTDENCVEDSDNSVAECTNHKYVMADVVHINVSFDSDAPEYDDGANSVTLSLPRKDFTATELEQIKHDAFGKASTSLVKLHETPFAAKVLSPNYSNAPNCENSDDGPNDPDCANVKYDTVNISKVRLSVTR
jgi:hypothetical protein